MLLLTAVAILFATAADGQGLATREQTILNVFGRLNLADNPFDNLNYWTDGSVFFRPFFFDVCSFGVEPRADSDTIFLCGGSLHEGGWGYEILLAADGKMTIATDDFRFKKGDRMEYRIIGGDTLLLFSDVGTGAVKDMFKKFDGNLYQRYIDNFYQYIFDGKFKHMEGSGDAVVFTRDKSAVSGLLSKNETSFTFIEKFGDTPVPALRFGKDVAYKVTKMLIGIELSSLLPEEEEWEWEWVMEADNSKPAIMLVKTDEGQADLPPGRFPLVSGQAMTLTELDIYAGEPKLSNLKVMRNEIFARYGYKFKTRDMADFFGTQDWYFPTHDDVASGLTEIERINIALIQALEKQYNN